MNVRTIRLLARGLLLALTLTAPLGAVPVLGEDAKAFLWTGVRGNIGRAPRLDVEVTSYGNGAPGEIRRVRPDEHANGLRAELAELRLAEATEGPSAERDAARLELWIRACDDQAFAGQGEFLVELTLDRAESLAARGETEAALAATQELLVPARLASQAGEFELREADAAWLERAAAWLADPALVALRERLAPPQAAQAATGDVDKVIEQHLRDGNNQAVQQFGLRAVPVAEALIRAEPESYPALDMDDAMTNLFRLSEERGARLALELLEQPSEIVPVRVLRAMRAAKVLENEGTWDFVRGPGDDDGMRSARLREPVWCAVLEVLCAQPVVALDACTEVGFLVSMDALTPGLSAFLERAIQGSDAALSQRALGALAESGRRASSRALLERLLASDSEQVRTVAADNLAEFEECAALWTHADDSSLDVRAAIVRGLRPEDREELSIYGVRQFQLRPTHVRSSRGLDRGGMRALETLLADRDPSIYLQALDILRDNPGLPMSADRLRALVQHPDERVRSVLPKVFVDGVPDPAVLEILAGDPETSVLAQVDRALSEVAAPGPLPTPDRPLSQGQRVVLGMSTSWSDEFLPALLRRLEHPMGRFAVITGALVTAAHTRPGAVALAERGTTTGSDDVANLVVGVFTDERPWDMGVSPWNLIEPDAARALLARAWRSPPDAQRIHPTANELYSGPMAFRAAGARWLADAELPWSVRFLGAYVSASEADDAWTGNLLALLAQGEAAMGALAEQYGGSVAEMARNVPAGEFAGRSIAAVAARSDLPETFAIPLVENLAERAVLAPDQAEAVLERWAPLAHRYRKTVSLALASVEATDEQPKLELFGRFLGRDQVSHCEKVLEVMGRLHLRAHLPLLERALLGEFAANEQLRVRQQIAAATALASYLDDEAAQILLRGVGSTTQASVRDACFAALDTIRRYQDERARWNSRADAGRARAESIAELIGLIETGDPVQKIEAVRALGTLEALEELPRLVRLAGSKDAALAKAAKEALERIHAADGKAQD